MSAYSVWSNLGWILLDSVYEKWWDPYTYSSYTPGCLVMEYIYLYVYHNSCVYTYIKAASGPATAYTVHATYIVWVVGSKFRALHTLTHEYPLWVHWGFSCTNPKTVSKLSYPTMGHMQKIHCINHWGIRIHMYMCMCTQVLYICCCNLVVQKGLNKIYMQ